MLRLRLWKRRVLGKIHWVLIWDWVPHIFYMQHLSDWKPAGNALRGQIKFNDEIKKIAMAINQVPTLMQGHKMQVTEKRHTIYVNDKLQKKKKTKKKWGKRNKNGWFININNFVGRKRKHMFDHQGLGTKMTRTGGRICESVIWHELRII